MQKYIDQLIADIKQTIKEIDLDTPDTEPTIDDILAESERFVENDALVSMFAHFGFKKEDFPPEDKLSDSQVEKLTFAILIMWAIFNYTAVFPDEIPPRLLYPLLCKRMEEPTLLMEYGHINIEFCEYNPETCPFGKYCDCDFS